MNKQTRIVLILVTMAVLLAAGVMAAAAAPFKPWIHVPQCTTSTNPPAAEEYPWQVILVVRCTDAGDDINEAFIMESNAPVSYKAYYDGKSATLVVFQPAVRHLILAWCVADAQGNAVIQKFSWP